MSISISALSPNPIAPVSDENKTNTIIITSLPQELFRSFALDTLRKHFSSYGRINQFVPIGGFGRVIIVYEDEDAAETAKRLNDPVVIESTEHQSEICLRVFRADRNPLIPTNCTHTVPETAYLRPPAIEKNFLISPPGSPPVGWEQVREDPPNVTPLADDLVTALKKLQAHRNSGFEVVIEPEEAGVGVYVEDFDWCPDQQRWVGEEHEEEADWSYGGASFGAKWKPAPTALPTMPTAVM